MTLSATKLSSATVHGSYLGSKFSGRVVRIESNASGYASDRNAMRIVIKVDADIPYVNDPGYNLRKAGETIIMHAESVNGGLTRNDDKYDYVYIRPAA